VGVTGNLATVSVTTVGNNVVNYVRLCVVGAPVVDTISLSDANGKRFSPTAAQTNGTGYRGEPLNNINSVKGPLLTWTPRGGM
jgi:hypothetical protein